MASPPRLMSLTPLSQPRQPPSFLRSVPRALHFLSPLNVDPPTVSFRDGPLSLAAAYVQRYLATRATLDWTHIRVRLEAYEPFLKAMASHPFLRTLAFSCWCDGDPEPHRHLIVVARRGRFETCVVPRVQPRISATERIVSPLHLVDTLGELSQEISRCQKGALKARHVYISKTLPKLYRLALLTVWENGLSERLYQEKRLRKTPDPRRKVVLPVHKELSPTSRKTRAYVYRENGAKLYFERDPYNLRLDTAAWIEKQAKGGNVFDERLGQERQMSEGCQCKTLKRVLKLNAELVRQNATVHHFSKRLKGELLDMLKTCET